MTSMPVLSNAFAFKLNPQGAVNLPEEDFVCQYKEDIWKTLLQQDADRPVIHLQSPQLAFRGRLVQQLRALSQKMALSISTLHMAVAQLDLFMDKHRIRDDRLRQVALACLSLAAKSEEKQSRLLSLKVLAKASGIQVSGRTFRRLEWMVGRYLQWRLLAPTPVTFAGHLANHVVETAEVIMRHPRIVQNMKRDGAMLLMEYLDLTLSDVRLRVADSVDLGCACVACARADMGLCAWPPTLIALSGRTPHTVVPIARFLRRMMLILKRREDDAKEASRRCSRPRGWAREDPRIAPQSTASTIAGLSETSLLSDDLSITEQTDTDFNPPQDYYAPCQRVYTEADYRYVLSIRLLEASLGTVQPSTSMAVKRGSHCVNILRKRSRRS